MLVDLDLGKAAHPKADPELLHVAAAGALMRIWRIMGHKVDAPRLRTVLVHAIQGEPPPKHDDPTPTAPLKIGMNGDE